MRRVLSLVLLLVCAAVSYGQSVKLPAKLSAIPGQWVIVAPESIDGGAPRWEWSDGLTEVDLSALFGPELAGKARGKVFVASKPGSYVVAAWNAKGDVASPISRCVITVQGGGSGPSPGPSPTDPPPVLPTDKCYFLVVRPDGPAHPDLVRLLSLPAWAGLTSAGHVWRDATLTEARATGADVPAGTLLPCVVVLSAKPDGGWRQAGIAKMPTTDAEVVGLPKAVTK